MAMTLLLASWGLSTSSFADEVTLTSGEHLKGEVICLEQGKLKFHSEALTEISLCWPCVTQLTTEKNLEICLCDGKSYRGKLKPSEEGDSLEIVSAAEGDCTYTVQRNSIVALRQPPCADKPYLEVNSKWSGKVAVGMSAWYGNNDFQDWTGNILVTRDTKYGDQLLHQWLFKMKFREKREDERVKTHEGEARLAYEHYLSKCWSWRLEEEMFWDRADDLILRSELTPSIGRYIIKNDDLFTFKVNTGPSWVDEFWNNEPRTLPKLKGHHWDWWIGYEAMWKLTKSITLRHEVDFSFQISRPSNTFFESDFIMSYKLCPNWEIMLEHDYIDDHSPLSRTELTWDNITELKLAYVF